MLTQIDVMSDIKIELPIFGITPKSSSLLVQKVTGLNPPDRNLFIGDYSQDGGIYQGRRVGPRNVVFMINLNPNPALGETAASLREKLYKAFIDPQVDGDYLKLVLHENSKGTIRQMYLVGYCEKFESEIFDIETMCQISMICPDPYLRDDGPTIIEPPIGGYTEFPFVYQGSAETGFVARIYVTSPTDQITLENNNKTMELFNPIADGYANGDIIIINTIRGERSITITKPINVTAIPTEFTPPTAYSVGDFVFYGSGIWRAASEALSSGTTYEQAPGNNNSCWDPVSTSIVSHLSPLSPWLELHSIDNTMSVYEGADVESVVASIKYLKYTSAYWGV